MARGINKVILVGNLGREPDVRYSQAGNAVTKFSVATSDSWRDRQSGEQHDRTEWHNVVCFSRLGEIARDYLKKGSKVYIEGSLRTDSWEQNGQKRYRTEIIARDMQMLDSRGEIHTPPPGVGPGPAPAPAPEPAGHIGNRWDSGIEQRADQAPAPMENRAPANAATISDDNDDFDDDIPF